MHYHPDVIARLALFVTVVMLAMLLLGFVFPALRHPVALAYGAGVSIAAALAREPRTALGLALTGIGAFVLAMLVAIQPSYM